MSSESLSEPSGGSGGQLRVAAEEAARAAPALPAHAVHVLLHWHRLCLHGSRKKGLSSLVMNMPALLNIYPCTLHLSCETVGH